PQSVPDLAPIDQGGTVAPSAYTAGAGGPSVAVATYDPATGQYATPDGNVFRQTDLVTQGGQRSWKDLLPTT
ncbi:MAG TPA: virulence factor Mce, partial [Mycobacterium sp.]|nr:virulence factor Mce [Mycobacterium sp.]